jgi:diphosphomevalonate decarboxylase
LITTTTFEEGTFFAELNHQPANQDDIKRIRTMMQHFPHDRVRIRSHNHFPTAAGLASSASGFAALALGLNAFFNANLSLQELASLARLGSGSACRSLTPDFTIWNKIGGIETLANPFPDLRMIVVVIQEEKKPISSREAMKISVASSSYFNQWIVDSEQDLIAMKDAIQHSRFHEVGRIMEINSERLYRVMKTSQPIIDYRLPKTHQLLMTISTMRDQGVIGYATLDAGPNVKILVEERFVKVWISQLELLGFNHYMVSRVGGLPRIDIKE